ncbi:MAG: phosphatidate cytidylyltransferase, partial [Flavobacteriia bacterium]|nr:phosphatidate cytidylyltransferase [Flavobacteriia bacterium]
MTTDWINAAILSVSFLALFGIAELLYHFAHVKVELTRKLVHLGTGVLTLLFPLMLSNHWFVL